jgi:hypothetical protein
VITFFTSSSAVITMIRTPDVERNKKNQIILDVEVVLVVWDFLPNLLHAGGN